MAERARPRSVSQPAQKIHKYCVVVSSLSYRCHSTDVYMSPIASRVRLTLGSLSLSLSFYFLDSCIKCPANVYRKRHIERLNTGCCRNTRQNPVHAKCKWTNEQANEKKKNQTVDFPFSVIPTLISAQRFYCTLCVHSV